MQEQWGEELEVVIRVLQVALAPAFLLAAISGLLNVVTGRLARVVDRTREVQDELSRQSGEAGQGLRDELIVLGRRRKLVRRSMQLGVAAGMVICLMVALLFVMGLAQFSMASVIVTMFSFAMRLIAASLGALLMETGLAGQEVAALGVPDDLGGDGGAG